MNNAEARLVTVLIVCLLAAILGKLWQVERALKASQDATTSCTR